MKLKLCKSIISSLVVSNMITPMAAHSQIVQDQKAQVATDKEQKLEVTAYEGSDSLDILRHASSTPESIKNEKALIAQNQDLSDADKAAAIKKIDAQVSAWNNLGLKNAGDFLKSAKAQTMIAEQFAKKFSEETGTQLTASDLLAAQNDDSDEDVEVSVDVVAQDNGQLVPVVQNTQADNQKKAPEKKKKKQNFFQREIERYRFRETVDPIKGTWASLDTNYQIAYQIVVEPSLRNGEQARQDIYFIDMNYVPQIYKQLYGTVGGMVRITFTRYFTGRNAKLKALTKLPYWVDKIPFSTKDINKDLKEGDTVRAEVVGRIGLSSAKSNAEGRTTTYAFVGWGSDALFMIDLYKHDEKYVRTRFVGVKNRGTLSVGASAKVKSNAFSLIRSAFDISVGFNISQSFALMGEKEYPIDTMMTDMTFNTQSTQQRDTSESSVNILDDLIEQSRKLKFIKLFIPATTSSALKEDLLARLKRSQDAANEDRERIADGRITDPSDFRVRINFKGSMQSSVFSQTGKIKLTSLVGSAEQTVGTLRSFITAYSDADQKNYFLLENSYTRQGYDALLGRTKVREYLDTDVLIHSNEKKEALELSDISVKTTYTNKKFDKDDINAIRQSLLNSLPVWFRTVATPTINELLPSRSQGAGTISHQYNFGRAAIVALANRSKQELLVPLDLFLSNHNKNHNMNLPPMQVEGISSPAVDDFNRYLDKRAKDLAIIFDTNTSTQKRHELLRELKYDLVFQKYILGEFVSSILPQQTDPTVEDPMSLRLYVATKETPAVVKDIGNFKNTEVYNAVNFLRSVINDRKYDIRFEEASVSEQQANDFKNAVVPKAYVGQQTIKDTKAED